MKWLRWAPIAAAAVLIVTLGVVQGLWSDRWDDSKVEAVELAQRLERVPMVFGDWVGEDQVASEEELKASGAVGSVTRIYRNQTTGDVVSLYIVSGHARDVSVHTPDRCYPAAGFTQLREPFQHAISCDGEPAEFYTTVFRKQNPEGTQLLRIFWSWGHDGRWVAPTYPRAEFGNVRGLYKVYFASTASESNQPIDECPTIEFAREVIPALQEALMTDSAPQSDAI